MTNIEALKAICNAIANTFYPDEQTMKVALLNANISADATAKAKDAGLFRVAVNLVIGYIESSRSENGISTSVRADAIKKSIRHWCGEYGIDADDILSSESSIEDISYIW